MSGEENAALWKADALNADQWIAVRRIAHEALAELDRRPVSESEGGSGGGLVH